MISVMSRLNKEKNNFEKCNTANNGAVYKKKEAYKSRVLESKQDKSHKLQNIDSTKSYNKNIKKKNAIPEQRTITKIEEHLEVLVDFYCDMAKTTSMHGKELDAAIKHVLNSDVKHMQRVNDSLKFLECCITLKDDKQMQTIPYYIICKIAELRYLLRFDPTNVLFVLSTLQRYMVDHPEAFAIISSAIYSCYAEYPTIVRCLSNRVNNQSCLYL